ncbi:MAG TPA: TonB-dependent receptor [Gemmatimonadaceae bacterium]|nr:TonB-dependent receptor [Gemmatimonadaceae bacterium]
MKSKLRLLSILAGAVFAPEVEAQEQTSADSARVNLPPVTVTATRQSTSLFTVPLAVTMIGSNQLETRRGYSLDEALTNVPGVFAQSRYGASDIRLTIRGFGARGAGDRSNAGTSRGVRVLIDGIPETEPDGRTAFDMVDLAAVSSIEVVRSNASALWGNAGGGVIALRTVPNFSESFASVQQMAGSYGFRRTAVRGAADLGSSMLGVTFTNTVQDGYRAHADSRRFYANATLTSQLRAGTELGIFASAANDLFHIPGPLTMAEATTKPRMANATYAARDERRYNRVGKIGVSLNHSPTGASSVAGMVFVNPKLLQRSERGTFRDFNRYHLGGNLVYRAPYDLKPGVTANTVVGADRAYQDGSILFYGLSSTNTRGTDLRDNKAEGALNTGVFAQEQIAFGAWGADLGARWDEIRYDYRSFINPKLNVEKKFSRVSPKIGINYRAGPTQSFYANVGGGVEAPAGNETDPASTFGQDTVSAINPLLDPIHSTTYEAGTRQVFPVSGSFLSSLSYDVALYHTDVTNEIIPYRGGRFYFTAGKARRQGAELGAALNGTNDLEVAGSVTMSRNNYIEYTVDSVHYGRPGKLADYAGNKIAGVPPLFYGLTIARSISEAIPVRVQVSARGTGEYFVDDANAVNVPGYHTFAAAVSTSHGIRVGNVVARPFLSIENLTDERFIGSAFVNPDVVSGVPVAFEPGAGRAFVFSVSIGSH